jgi:hypothetical protein
MVLLAACNSRQEQQQRELEAQERKVAESIERLERALDIVDAGSIYESPIPDRPIDIPVQPDVQPEAEAEVVEPPCIDLEYVDSVAVVGGALRICQDGDDEGALDCFTVSRAGKVTKLEHHDAPIPARVDIVDNKVEICAPHRACVRIGPELASDESLHYAEVDHDDPSIAGLLIADGDGVLSRLELWDLDRGRQRARTDLTALAADAGDANLEFAGSAVVLFTDGDDTNLMHATLFGLDGKRRATLAGGSGRIQYYATTDRMVAVFSLGAEDIGEITGYDLATGKKLGRHDMTPVDPDLHDMDAAGGRSIVLGFGGDGERLEIIDLATGKVQTRTVPTCE